MDQLLAMRAFVRVVEAGTFTRASDSLAVPKATVTKLIQGLEAASEDEAPQSHDPPRDRHPGRGALLRPRGAAACRHRRTGRQHGIVAGAAAGKAAHRNVGGARQQHPRPGALPVSRALSRHPHRPRRVGPADRHPGGKRRLRHPRRRVVGSVADCPAHRPHGLRHLRLAALPRDVRRTVPSARSRGRPQRRQLLPATERSAGAFRLQPR